MKNGTKHLAKTVVVLAGILVFSSCGEEGEELGIHLEELAAHSDGGCGCEQGCARAQDRAREPAEPSKAYQVPLGDSPAIGPEGARVTIVVACDFQCRYCKRAQTVLEQVRQTYGNSVRIVFKHNPMSFHDNALSAAVAAEAAREQGRFWEMHDLLLAGQQDLGEELYHRSAQQIGLDMARFEADRASSRLAARVEADQQLVRSIGGRGTPSFWINGRLMRGAQPFERFRDIIFEILAADQPAAAGTTDDM